MESVITKNLAHPDCIYIHIIHSILWTRDTDFDDSIRIYLGLYFNARCLLYPDYQLIYLFFGIMIRNV